MMPPDNLLKFNRCLAVLMSMVFATATSTPITAQTRILAQSQASAPENSTDSGDTEPVQAFGGQLAVFLGHESYVNSAVFSPDGKHILTASGDGTFRLWDRGGNLLKIFQGSEETITMTRTTNGRTEEVVVSVADGVKSAVFSPNGRQILTVIEYIGEYYSDSVSLWDIQGNLLLEIKEVNSINTAVFSPDGNQILTASEDKTARLWDRDGNLLTEFQGHKDRVRSAVFSPDGNQILTASEDKTARLWDRNGNLLTEFQGHEDLVFSAVFSPNGSHILTVSSDGTARLWDNQGNLRTNIRVYQKGVRGSNTMKEYVRESEYAEYVSYSRRGRDEGGVTSAAFSPDGHQILTASWDNTARLWDRDGNLLAEFRGHALVKSAVFSRDGSQILTTDNDGTARLWDVSATIAAQVQQRVTRQTFQEGVSKSNAQLIEIQGHDTDIKSAEFSPDGRQILTASWDHTARLWDRDGNQLAVFPHEDYVNSAVFSPDGRQILTASNDRTAHLWDRDGNQLAIFRGHESYVKSAVFSPDGSQILTASWDDTARLWDRDGNQLAVFRGHESFVTSAVFSPDGRQILTTSDGGTTHLWDRNGNQLAVFQHNKYGDESAVFSPDGRQILTASWDDTARLWDRDGNQLAVFRGHESYVKSAVFSPDGRQILTASIDKTARLWDRDGNQLAVFRGHHHFVESAVFSPDGSQILTAGADGTARLWDVSTALENQAEQMAALRDFKAGLSDSNAEQATAAFEEAVQLNQQGTVESKKLAFQNFEKALELYRADNNHAKAAEALLSMGDIYTTSGKFQSALDSYNQALTLSQQAGAITTEAIILNSLGELYHNLADAQTALDYYNQAMPFWYQLNHEEGAATTLNNIGNSYAVLGKRQPAREAYNQALAISRTAGDTTAETAALMGLGNTYIATKQWATAQNAYRQAQLIAQTTDNKIQQTTILNQMGQIQAALGNPTTALETYNQALALSQQLGYKTESARILYHQAILNRQQNNLTAAKTEIETAINIIEELRTEIASQDLRQSYFARNQDYYQFYIDLLMELHQQNPENGYDGEALHISERARARSLLELLSEATANIRTGVDPQLLAQERDLQAQLNNLEHRKYQLVSREHTATELNTIKQKIATTLGQLDQLEAQIRVASPGYANLKYPQPLTLQEIQQQILDEDTLLLEYALGAERSYLWAVTQDSITSYELPPQREIEAALKTFRESLQNTGATLDSGIPLSQIILAPVASQLPDKRLLIVGDGVLQLVPFAALPLPSSPSTPLLVQNEIITLSSASTVAIQRQQLENRSAASKTLAVLADPVFSLTDTRFANQPTQPDSEITAHNSATRAARNLGLGEGGKLFDRLNSTRTEAQKILALVPERQQLPALGFQASREIATDPKLADYQIIHLATHGLLDPVNPQLSGVVLSLFDQTGQPQDGFLRLHDIFNLNLPAELVVLSACQTGLGEVVKGEGLVGLTRGFMYAGARRVAVSLWSVDDVATAELMTKFYQNMLTEKQNPVMALREAQLEMWNSQQWKSPYYWAAFTVQGDWQ